MYEGMIVDANLRLKKWNTELVVEEKALACVKDELKYYDFWTEGFSDRGLISFVIDQMLPVLNRKMNEKLQVLSDGDMMVVLWMLVVLRGIGHVVSLEKSVSLESIHMKKEEMV